MGTFAYGDSYYGLRSYDQTTGAVKDASATATATSSIPNVDWLVSKGGDASTTATSSATASGEVIVLELSDKFAYGTGLYGSNEYDQADLQTIVSATSSTSVASGIKIQNVIASTQIVHITVTNSHVGGSHKYFIDSVQQPTLDLVEGTTYTFSYSSTHPFSLSTTSDGTHNSGSEYTTGTTRDASANTLTFICPDNAPQLYYYCSVHSGMGGTANTNPQTVVTASAEKVYQGSAISSASASTTANAVYTIIGDASSSSVSGTTISYIRERNSSALVSTTSGTLTIGREKWEVISPTSTTWTTIAA
jgi:hypothetical protein